ncbi:MAG: Ig-like domain-containing protein [Sulfurovum sp.]|nr:Ig-like domain-containing protein [Sulfurovum sp.]
MGKKIAVIVKEGQNVISNNTVAEGSSKPLIIKAGSNQSYELKDIATGVAPDQIYVVRDGKNLKIKIGRKDKKSDGDADIIIEEYFEHDNTLIGVAENGEYYNFIPQGADPAASYYSLGGETLVESETDWLPIILGVLGAGAIAAAASGGGGGGGGKTGPDNLTVELYDDQDPIEGEITSGTSTNDTTPVISGVTEADAKVTAYDDQGNELGTTTADESGNYTIDPKTQDKELSEGQHYIQVIAEDAEGNTITKSTGIFTVDITPPNPPILNPTDGSPITGIAEAGSTVTITYNDVTATTTADENGNFTYTPDSPIQHNTVIEATATDAAGNESDPGTTTVNSAIPDAPVVYDDVPPVTGVIENNTTTDDTTPTITGSGADAGSTIHVYDNGTLLGTTTSDTSGNWSLQVQDNEAFEVGSDHSITYKVNGGPSSPSVDFAIDVPPVIDLGGDGQLIHPVFVDGNWYYYWDRDGDGQGKTSGGSDKDDWFTHDELDAIFMYDANGNQRPDNLEDTTDTYRYAELGGYQVALPTYGAETYGVQQGTEIDNIPPGEFNPYYDDLVAIWDAFNGNGTTTTTAPGTPDGWSEGFYWSASEFETIGSQDEKHYTMDLTNGLGGTNGDHDTYWVAVQVVF